MGCQGWGTSWLHVTGCIQAALSYRWTQNWHQPVLTIPLPHPAFVHDPLPAPPSALEGIRNLPRAPGALWVMLEQHSRLPLLPGTGRKPWTESSGLPELTIWAKTHRGGGGQSLPRAQKRAGQEISALSTPAPVPGAGETPGLCCWRSMALSHLPAPGFLPLGSPEVSGKIKKYTYKQVKGQQGTR